MFWPFAQAAPLTENTLPLWSLRAQLPPALPGRRPSSTDAPPHSSPGGQGSPRLCPEVPSLLPESYSQQQPEEEGGYLGTFGCQPVWAPVLAGPLASGGALSPNFLIGKLGIQVVPASHGFERINKYTVTKPQQTGWPSVSSQYALRSLWGHS